jgi:PadR family transcriptional regulator PadR
MPAMTGHIGEFEQLVLLALLRLGSDAYGVTVRREIHQRTGRDVSQGAVYTVLNRLSEKGLVRWRIAETAPERGGRRRKYYELRPAGARALERSISDVRSMAKGLMPKLAELAEGLS